MNKQILVAGLLGAASATADNCINPAVTKATAAQAKAVQAHADEVARTAGLTAASEAATAAWTPVNAALAPRAAARGALDAAAASATAAAALRADARSAASADVTALGLSEGAADGLLQAAVARVAPAQTAIDDDQAVYDELAKAVADHEVTLAAAEAAAVTANTNNVNAGTAYTNAVASWNTLRVKKAEINAASDQQQYSAVDGSASGTAGVGAANGSAKVLADATSATAAAKAAWTAGVSGVNTLFTNWQPVKAALANANTLKTAADAACDSTCQAQTGSPVLAQKTASGVDVAASGGGTTAYDLSLVKQNLFEGSTTFKILTASPYTVTAPVDGDTGSKGQAGRWANWARLSGVEAGKKKLDDDEATAVETARLLAVSTLAARDTAVTGTAALLLTANGAVTDATAARDADNAKLPTVLAGLNASKAAIVTLNDDVVVQTYLKGLETAKLAAANAALAAYSSGESAEWSALQVSAAAALATADAALAELQAELTPFADAKADAEADVVANTQAIAARAADIVTADAALAMAISVCKGNGYDRAQEALRADLAKRALDRDAALQVKSDYEAKAAFAGTGSVNFPCAMKNVDGTMTRPECAEGQCCGAAQKFRRDGTKLTVETCQEEIGTHTYTYYPPLPEGATVEPTPETWRFQCISGAQKLVAATAAIAAAFAMA